MTVQLLQDYYAAWGTGEPDRVAAFFSADAIFEDLAFEAKFEGPQGVRQFAELTYSGIPDFKVVPSVITIDGFNAAAAWDMSGTHLGDLPNMPATGNRFTVRASSIIEFRDAKITKIVDYWNPVQFQRAVGLI